MLSADHTYLWLAGILSVLLLFIYFLSPAGWASISGNSNVCRVFGREAGACPCFPKDELGDVSRELVELYGRLKESEDDKPASSGS